MTEQGKRTLSDADVEAIAKAMEDRLTSRMVRGAGTGALAILKKLVLWAVIGLLGYALAHGWRP